MSGFGRLRSLKKDPDNELIVMLASVDEDVSDRFALVVPGGRPNLRTPPHMFLDRRDNRAAFMKLGRAPTTIRIFITRALDGSIL